MKHQSNHFNYSYEEKYWQNLYQELVELVGKENTLILYQNYKGVSVNFPVKLISHEGLTRIIEKEYNGTNATELAKKYGYTVRHVYRIINKNK